MSQEVSNLPKALCGLVVVIALLLLWREIVPDEGDLTLLMLLTVLAPLFLGPIFLLGRAKSKRPGRF